MQISNVSVTITTDDLNGLIQDLAPESKIRVQHIDEEGIHAQLRLFLWNVDVTAKPSSQGRADAAIDVTAHKLVAIPGAIVERQLKEAVKDGPPGVAVIEQSLRVHLPALLQPLGIDLMLDELQCVNGAVRVTVSQVQFPKLQALLRKRHVK